VTPADFDSLTRNRALCEADGTLTPQRFESMMREQVRLARECRRESSEWAAPYRACLPCRRRTRFGAALRCAARDLRLCWRCVWSIVPRLHLVHLSGRS
jgi:hypothetical protein